MARINDIRMNNNMLLPPESIGQVGPVNLNLKEPSLLHTQGHNSLGTVGLLDLPDDDPSSDSSQHQKGTSSLHLAFLNFLHFILLNLPGPPNSLHTTALCLGNGTIHEKK